MKMHLEMAAAKCGDFVREGGVVAVCELTN